MLCSDTSGQLKAIAQKSVETILNEVESNLNQDLPKEDEHVNDISDLLTDKIASMTK